MTLKSLFSAGAIITIGMLVGRFLGLLREILLASHFGINASADMAIALLIIPDFITSALIASAASAALIPAFAAREKEGMMGLFWQALVASVVGFAVIALLLFTQQNHIRAMMSPEVAALPQATLAFFITLCSLPVSAATSIITAYLQYRGRFVAPAFANAVFNVIVIFTLWALPGGLAVFAGGILVATLVRLLTHLGAFSRLDGISWKPVLRPLQMDKPLAKAYVRTAGSGIFGMLPYYAPYAVIAYVGSSVALFNYAFKLVMLPGLMLQTLVQMLLLPWFVKITNASDADKSRQSYGISLQLVWIIAWVVSMSLSLVGPQVAVLCFGYGKMTGEAIAQVGHLFVIGVWAMPGMVLTSVWQQILYANNHTGAPLLSSILQALLVMPLCWLGYNMVGPAGVLIAYIIVQSFPVVILAFEGVKRGVIHSVRPAMVYGHMTFAATAVFLPLAWLEQLFVLPAFAGVAVACLIGILSLGAGLCVCHPVRQWSLQQLRRP